MIKFLILLLFTFQTYSWIPQKNLPYELESLINSIDNKLISKEQSDLLKYEFGKLSFYHSQMDKSSFYFIFKVSLYKYLLRNAPQVKIPSQYYLQSYLATTSQSVLTKDYNQMIRWIWNASAKDLELYLKDKSYTQFEKAKADNKKLGPYSTLDKKIKLTLSWMIYLKSAPSKDLNLDFVKHFVGILKDVNISLVKFVEMQSLAPLKMPKSFSLTNIIKSTEGPEETSTLKSDQKLDKIIEKAIQSNLPQPVNDWNKNDDFLLEKAEFSKDNLPEPVDDWLLEY